MKIYNITFVIPVYSTEVGKNIFIGNICFECNLSVLWDGRLGMMKSQKRRKQSCIKCEESFKMLLLVLISIFYLPLRIIFTLSKEYMWGEILWFFLISFLCWLACSMSATFWWIWWWSLIIGHRDEENTEKRLAEN